MKRYEGMDMASYYRGKVAGRKAGAGGIVMTGDEYEVTEPNNDGGLVIRKKEREEVTDNVSD